MTESGIECVEAQAAIHAMDPPRAPENLTPPTRFWPLVLLLGSLSAIGPLAIDMYLPAFKQLAPALGTDEGHLPLTLASYFVGLSFGQLFYGPLSDRLGRKLPLNIGLGVFIVASLLCAMASSLNQMIALRFLQALGGCAQMVVARAMVRDLFSTRDAARVYSTLMLVMGVAPIVAPLLGGWFATHWSWRAIFITQAIFAGLCVLTVNLMLAESLPSHRRQRTNLAGVMRTYAGMLQHRAFMSYAIIAGLVSAGMFAYVGGSPFILMRLFGVPEQHFGLYFGLNAAGFIGVAQINGLLVHRVHPRTMLRIGLTITLISGALLLLVAETGFGGMIGFLLPLFGFISSLGLVMPTTTALALEPFGRTAGNASALLGFVQFILSAGGGMIMGLIDPKTAIPLAMVLCVCGVLSFLLLLTLRQEPEEQESPVAAV